MRGAAAWISGTERSEALLSGSLELSDGRQIAVSVTGITKEGCEVLSDETLRIGSHIILRVAPFDGFRAQVRWALVGTAGVRFDPGQWS
jgi:hypothetical protein